MENILVIDNFLNEEEYNTVMKIMNSKTWIYGQISNQDSSTGIPFWYMLLSDSDFFTKNLKEKIEKEFSRKFNLQIVYANGQTFGQDGEYHTDSDNLNAYTFCLYLNDISNEELENVGGELCIKIPEKKYGVYFPSLFNRGILFPSNYYHKGNAFGRLIKQIRVCFAWKLEEI